MLTNLERLQAIREAATVQRCHTVRHQGSYDLAQHSFGVASIILCLHPSPSIDLLKSALWHDMHERWTGDIPHPVKEMDDTLLKGIKEIERRYSKYVCGFDADADLFWLVGADMLDLWLWANDHAQDSAGVVHVRAHVQGRIFNNLFVPHEIKDALAYFLGGTVRLDLLAEKIQDGAHKIEKGLKSTCST